ncbi:MAG: thymidine kinase [Bacteroidetes bacterium]|nr:thymidine kinase [Bacteroidota bacterium]
MFLEQFPGRQKSNGWLEVISGSMFSGKTEELIRRLKRAEFAKQSILLFKPKVDNRYSEENVVSHLGTSVQAIAVENSSEVLKRWKGETVVAIDEAQFFDKNLPKVCEQLANEGARVIAAGLDMDFKGKPFGPMPDLMALAEYITKVHAICLRCGGLAHFSHRTSEQVDLVVLGELQNYEPLCRGCFQQTKNQTT